jgi:hypothetical protein
MAADRTGLGILGLVFGGLTVAVTMTAFTVVLAHVEGRIPLDPPRAIAVSTR